MIYKVNRSNKDDISKYSLVFNASIFTEFDRKLGRKGEKEITIHLKFNGISEGVKHGPRIKVTKVPGDAEREYYYPMNPDSGEITYSLKHNPDNKICRDVAKIIAGFAYENHDIIKKYFGYRDGNGRIIKGDPSIERQISDAVDKYNSLSDNAKKEYIRKGKIKYKKK